MQEHYRQEPIEGQVISEEVVNAFFAPAQFDNLTLLVDEFERTKQRILEVHELITAERVSGVLGYFFQGNSNDRYGHSANLRHSNAFEEIFNLQGAISELTAGYWQRALDMTDLMEHMPQPRRSQWHKTLNAWREPGYKHGQNPENDMPDFTLDTLRLTIQSLLARRGEFVAERVDAVFRGLSGNHITNQPQGFQKRSIMENVFDEWGSPDYQKRDILHDLRLIISKFMGRGDPCRDVTGKILRLARSQPGTWLEVDGGALRIRAYKRGTAHFEVHPDMAYRLNQILAYLYPMAIPPSARRKPAAGMRTRPVFDNLLPNQVIARLASLKPAFYFEASTSGRFDSHRIIIPNSLEAPSAHGTSKHVIAEVESVLAAIGGVKKYHTNNAKLAYWAFDYNPEAIVAEVVALGAIPDQRSYQFYPTPEPVAQQLVDWLEIADTDTLLEPQAGLGGIADLLPKDRTLCVEISPLHCSVLKAKGHTTIEADFLGWEPGITFSVIAMNPPFSEGRWQDHLRKAGTLVAGGGKLGAVLPTSAVRQAADLLPGFEISFSEPIERAFAGTSISVVLLKAVKCGS